MFIIPEFKIIPPIILSDHGFLQFSHTFLYVTVNKICTLNTKLIFILHRTNVPATVSYLYKINWFHEFSTANNVVNCYTTFLKHLHHAINNFVRKLPTRTSKKLFLSAYFRKLLRKSKTSVCDEKYKFI